MLPQLSLSSSRLPWSSLGVTNSKKNSKSNGGATIRVSSRCAVTKMDVARVRAPVSVAVAAEASTLGRGLASTTHRRWAGVRASAVATESSPSNSTPQALDGVEQVWKELGVKNQRQVDALMTQWKAREDSDVDSVCLRNRLAHVKYLLQLDDKALRDLAINADPLLLQLSLHDLTSRMISLRAALPHTCDMFEMVHSEPSLLLEPDIGEKVAACFMILKAAMPEVDIDFLTVDCPHTMALVLRDCLDGMGDPGEVHPFLAGWLQGESSHATSRITCFSQGTKLRIHRLGKSWYKWPHFICSSLEQRQ